MQWTHVMGVPRHLKVQKSTELARRFQTLAHTLRLSPMKELSSLKSETVVQVVAGPASHVATVSPKYLLNNLH